MSLSILSQPVILGMASWSQSMSFDVVDLFDLGLDQHHLPFDELGVAVNVVVNIEDGDAGVHPEVAKNLKTYGNMSFRLMTFHLMMFGLSRFA